MAKSKQKAKKKSSKKGKQASPTKKPIKLKVKSAAKKSRVLKSAKKSAKKSAPVAKSSANIKYPTRFTDQPVQLTGGGSVQLSTLSGTRGLVVYFYPKDDTPGCSAEACSFRDNERVLHSRGVEVVGVSPDTHTSHQKFTQKFKLNFPLIADPDKKLVEYAGVWREKSMYGRKYMGVVRTTFLLDAQLNVKKVYESVRVNGHVEEILADLNLVQ